jgi:hypothetical protein
MNITLPNLKPDLKSLYIHKVDKIYNPIINFVCVYIYRVRIMSLTLFSVSL